MHLAPPSMKFQNEREVRVAFASGHLPWVRGDTATAITVIQDSEGRKIITEHRQVRILDTCGVTAAKDPVYLCETEGRELIQIEAQMLMTWQRLMSDERGQPSDYARWVKDTMDRKRARELSGFRTEVMFVERLFTSEEIEAMRQGMRRAAFWLPRAA